MEGAEGVGSRERSVVLERSARLNLRWLERIVILRLHPEVCYEFFEVSVVSPPHVLEEKLVHTWAVSKRRHTINHGVVHVIAHIVVHVAHVVIHVVHVVVHVVIHVIVHLVSNIVVVKDAGQRFVLVSV